MVWKITWGIWQIFIRALASLKIGTVMGFFCSKLKMYELKTYLCKMNLCIKTMKNDAKIEEELTCQLTSGIWSILIWLLENLKNLHFNWLPLTKIYNVWAKKVQGSYVWWHWILIQNLKENWLSLSKITWGIWEIFTWKPQNLGFDGIHLSKVEKVSA